MKKEKLTIIATKQIAKATFEMKLENIHISENAVPGQFLHILMEGHTLGRPISIADIDKQNHIVTILFKVVGSGTKRLAEYRVGQQIDALGPSGNGFPSEQNEKKTVLLIGGGIGVPPMYYLGKQLAEQNVNVIAILGFQTAENVFYEEKFNQVAETYIVTDDGSYGEEGFVTDLLDQVGNFDCYYTCGPLPMIKAITDKLIGKRGYISLEERMGCGVGACLACMIPANNQSGYKKICSDGPVFSAEEVII
ncbi:dihydroorotate dehydrogenase electron transfer subunit [Oceanobacillus sp. 143]|uniref:Dihydroorotate dehydrogenase B (NAD(+)), electron transfer subunit n=1 Tax=Oceanobacillus zhaokaii TaxID=2052660 RepID=A0A345PG90_9BACI|nr:dihydroorotate dehydrogenase electron transfer subunit [Oceanobacillus zhaokaii]AXI09020.1 dihydroorotate dehydrogenase electron transfer subunit [Oceanobacillus zhaokaii]QGS68613.1 dihydroorotate dehydrogenase electron transfer subunit [Oceanobacillus sp. 143]